MKLGMQMAQNNFTNDKRSSLDFGMRLNSSDSYGVFNLIIIFFSVLSLLYSLKYVSLVPLPLFFLCFYLLFFVVLKTRLSFFNIVIILICSVRFLLIPIVYFASNTFVFSWFKPLMITNFQEVQLVMIAELFFIFLGIFSGDRFLQHSRSEKNHILIFRNGRKRSSNYVFIFLGVIAILIGAIYPGVISFSSSTRIPSVALRSIYQVGLECLFLSFFGIIYNSKLKRIWALILSFIVFVIFDVLVSVFLKSVSRNSFIINAVIFFLLSLHFYPESKKKIIISALIGVVLAFSLLTYFKMESKTFSWSFLQNTIEKYSYFTMLDSYFAGPVDIQIGLDMIEKLNIHGVKWFFYDFFNDIPILGHYLSPDDTVSIYNRFIYSGVAFQDITPTIIQSLIYFGPFMFWIFPFFMGFVPQVLHKMAFDQNDYILHYSLLYTAMLFAMSQIISWDAMSMLWFDYAFTIFVLYWIELLLENFVSRMRTRKANKVENL